MAERVFNLIQIGDQGGTMAAPGSAAAATIVFPGAVASWPKVDRGSGWPDEDRGRNARNPAGRQHHGARGVAFGLSGELRFTDLQYLLEMHFAGGITPTGTNPYTWATDFEVGSPTLKPKTIQMGSETSQDQWACRSSLIDELTIGFDDIDGPGFNPWTFDASLMAIDRTSTALTSSLSPLAAAMETLQGIYSILNEGGVGTAFGSLSELAASLIGFKLTTQRHLVLRHYGGTSDLATSFGFSERASGSFTMKVKVGATAKTDFHDIYLVAGGVGTERRYRIAIDGGGDNAATLDFRGGITNVEPSERSGEGVYLIEGELVDDSTLDALATLTNINNVSSLT